MAEQFGTTWADAASVGLATVVVYLAFVLHVRVLGQRTLASMTSFDVGVVLALGSVMGRTVLLETPTLAGGLVAMVVLFAAQLLFAVVRRNRRADRLLNRPPLLLLAQGRPLPENLVRGKVSEDELRQRLRLAGVVSLSEVQAVVLERNGAISVLRGGPLSPMLVEDVVDGHLLTSRPDGAA